MACAMVLSVTDEERNPFGGFLFSGSDDALSRLAEAAEREGLKLVAMNLGDDVFRLCLTSEVSFGTAGMALFNRSQAGEFGEVTMGVFGGTVQPQH